MSFAGKTLTKGGGIGGALLLCTIAIVAIAAESPQPNDSASASDPGLGSILGPDSSVDADGEMLFVSNAEGELESYRVQKNVRIVTKNLNIECEDFLYDLASGTITATGSPKDLVNITMRNMNLGGVGSKKSGTRATCRRYVFHIKEQRHVLSIDPVLYVRNKEGAETAVTGEIITINQDEKGRATMHVAPSKKGGTRLFDPSSKKSMMDVDSGGIIEKPGRSSSGPEAKPESKKPGPKNRAKIEAGNAKKRKPVEPSKVTKIEEGD